MKASAVEIRQLAINTIRTLAMDAVEKADSGHPGTPMALAPVAYSLWNHQLRYDPSNPDWIARDRFVLSCGHASMLLYSILHLAGVKRKDGSLAISIDDIRRFRQLHSPCAGHPEYGEAPGIETTTGPLGQGVGNSVGMAAASKWLNARYGTSKFAVCDFDVYAICSDGDMMEGVGAEAASLAGHLKLDNLCWIYDDNGITIEGSTALAFSENVARRFEGLGWSTIRVEDANDVDAMIAALRRFKSTMGKPTLIIVRSVIGYGAPNKQNTEAAHGAPLGEEEVRLAKEFYGWSDDRFVVPDGVSEHFQENLGQRGEAEFAIWSEAWNQYRSADPIRARELELIFSRQLPADWQLLIPKFEASPKGMATRASSGKVLNAVASRIPWLIGGSADLAGSNKSLVEASDAGHFASDQYNGRNFHFGVREHAMAAFCNGMALTGIRAYGATFFIFTDYLRPAMRLSAIMRLPVLYILTHDSIGLGEDGPTHQPVEHLAACRAIPNLLVMRPADANEVAQCYIAALSETRRPTALILTRQNVPTFDRRVYGDVAGVLRGAYVLKDCEATPDVILIGTGSEVSICVEASNKLEESGVRTRVVSMPCWELFDEQPISYKQQVLPDEVRCRVAVEAGVQQGWEKYIGPGGRYVGMRSFGASAPLEQLYEHFGITAGRVVETARDAMVVNE